MIDEIVSNAVALQQTKTQLTANMLVMKKRFDMQKQLVNMIAEVTRSAPPPPGQGTRVDKTA